MSHVLRNTDPELIAAVHTKSLWETVRGQAGGDDFSSDLEATCAYIFDSTREEAKRLDAIRSTLRVTLTPEPSGQYRLIHAEAKDRFDARRFIDRLTADGYVGWQHWTDGAAEAFYRASNELTLVTLGTDSFTVRVVWRRSKRRRLPRQFEPSPADLRSIALPGWAWPGYYMLRPFRIARGRFIQTPRADVALLGPILGTPRSLLIPLLEAAGVTSEDHVVDLGCGDGRLVVAAAAHFGCRATGFEHNPELAKAARKAVSDAGVQDRASIEQVDATTAGLADATVVVLFIPAPAVGPLVESLRSQGFAGRILSHEQEFTKDTVAPQTSTIVASADALTVAHHW